MQRSFEDLGTPLADVTFVVLDLETTGGSPDACRITEIGAVKYRGGECLGTFQTLVDPRSAIPADIVYLTGITPSMVAGAPPIEAALPALLEFVRDAVVVGHNTRFDMGFLQANAARLGYPRLTNQVIDTCALARRLVRDEVPNCTLSTLARHFRTAVDPCHRALADAQATADVFHKLLERAGSLGVLALDDLLALPRTAAHPQAAKLRWVASLPRAPGVYVFRDGAGDAIYVGKAVDLRRRVRSYFAGDDRRMIGPLLREARALDHVVCKHELEAEVLELRMIHELRPRFNRRDKNPDKSVYVKLSLGERFPRLSISRSVRAGDGAVYLGPLPSQRLARTVIDAIEAVVPVRRCAQRPEASAQAAPCAPAQLGVSTCPCSGATSEADYRRIANHAARAMSFEPALVLDPLHERMRALASQARFEDAATVRDRAQAFARAVERHRRVTALLAADRLVLEIDGGGAVIESGRMVSAWPAERPVDRGEPLELALWAPTATGLAKGDAAEALVIASWLERNTRRVRLMSCDGELAWPAARLPRFEPRRPAPRSHRAAPAA